MGEVSFQCLVPIFTAISPSPNPTSALSQVLPGCMLCRHTLLIHVNQSLPQDRHTKEVYFLCFFLCFVREEWERPEEKVEDLFSRGSTRAVTLAVKGKEELWGCGHTLWLDFLELSSSGSEDKTERRRRGKISVNLLRLVWEFEEGGRWEERGQKQGKQGELGRKH